MFENIQKTKDQTLAQFISAIGVEGVSVAKSEKIIAQGYNTLEKILSLDLEKMKSIEGFAEKSSQAFLDSLNRKERLIKELISLGVKAKADELASGEGPLQGMKFCITGELSMPRGEFEKLIKQNGGVMVSSVSKNTSYLITNETDSSSSKFVKAKDLGIPIVSEAKLLKMIEG
jgi:DNA ligase (NAD+)